jgi:DNA-binding Lrp family transcriptional regulator
MPVSSFNVKDMMEEDMDSRTYQLQTISNLYNSGIPNEIISSQLDITEEEVKETIEKITKEQEELIVQGSLASRAASSLEKQLAMVNVNLAIK